MATKKTVKKKVQYLGTGRRKTAIARVRLIPGEGNITINKRTFEDYFPLDTMRLIVNQPLEAVSATDKFDVIVNVHGGGMTGQAGAIRHGIARALCVCDREAYRSVLKKAGYLKRDPRQKERKKYGLHKARKAPQFSALSKPLPQCGHVRESTLPFAKGAFSRTSSKY